MWILVQTTPEKLLKAYVKADITPDGRLKNLTVDYQVRFLMCRIAEI